MGETARATGAPSHSRHPSFSAWLAQLKVDALNDGISAQTFDLAFAGVTPNPRVLELDHKQPEKKMGFADYYKNIVTQKRIDAGRLNYQENLTTLKAVEHRYGVPSEVLVALWGMETSYGKNTGGFDLIEALATLAYDGRRAAYFRKELLSALEILQGGHVRREDFKGSWAGAMGQNQFMPSSWHRYAVDYNADGHKDIWTTRGDVFASSANYLAQEGWDHRLPWGWGVSVPEGLSQHDIGLKHHKTLAEWIRLGVRLRSGGVPSGDGQMQASLIVPDRGGGRAYLVTRNFHVLMSWNRSTYFGITVGQLADFIKQDSGRGSPSPRYNN